MQLTAGYCWAKTCVGGWSR